MKLPLRPPNVGNLIAHLNGNRFQKVLNNPALDMPGGYPHWDKLRHLPLPDDVTHEEWWLHLKLGRNGASRVLPGLMDTSGKPFTYSMPDCVLEAIHDIDSRARGKLASHTSAGSKVATSDNRQRYMVSSLMEEAITSSQLEGAATTRQIAVEMLRSGRPPKDRSERMILNNYQAMQHIRSMEKNELIPGRVMELHRMVAEDTLDNPDAVGRLQRPDEERVRVVDNRDNTVLHSPPPAADLPERMQRLCGFANTDFKAGQTNGRFIHPLVKAISLHFWLAYDHPFEDGNGRTARALFYWAMLKEEYWLFEYISISSLLRQAPAKYARAFQHTETDDNDLTYFIHAQLTVICRALDALDEYLARKAEELAEAETRVRDMTGLNPRQRALVAHSLRHPSHEYSIESHQRSHGCAYATARSDLLKLAEAGLLEQYQQGKKMLFRPAQTQ